MYISSVFVLINIADLKLHLFIDAKILIIIIINITEKPVLLILTAICTDNIKHYTIKWMAITFL